MIIYIYNILIIDIRDLYKYCYSYLHYHYNLNRKKNFLKINKLSKTIKDKTTNINYNILKFTYYKLFTDPRTMCPG